MEWQSTTQYRETGRQVKVGPLDGRLMIILILLVLFPSKFLFYTLLVSMAFFWYLDYRGYTLPNALRRIHVALSGKKKFAVHYWRQKKFRF
jgi:hypothetical protein